MFNKRNKQPSQGIVLTETYIPAPLPKYGAALDTYITGDYLLLSDAYIQERYQACEEALAPLIETSDRFSRGELSDAFIDGQIAHLEARHQEEAAAHELQGAQIKAALAVRKGVIARRLSQLEEQRSRLQQELEPLQEVRAQFELRIGKSHIPLGLLVTMAAMIVDGLLNFSYLQGILLQSAFLLLICVVCLSVMSDGSMYVLGNLLSRRKERFMSKPLFWITTGGLAGMFLLSIAASVMIRFGSMDVTYGTINAAGGFVAKDSYSLAEWGVSLVTAFLTTATGLISLAFSVDENAHLADRRRELEASLAALEEEYEALSAERGAIEQAVDPMERDLVCRKAAEDSLRALRTGLKLHMRMLLAQHQQDATYTDAIGESAEVLLSPASAAAVMVPDAGEDTESEEVPVSEAGHFSAPKTDESELPFDVPIKEAV